MQRAQTKKIYSSLDGIRGVGAILIVLRHADRFFGSLSFQESYLAVDLFFVLSGFVLGNAYDKQLKSSLSGWRFFLLRIVRLYPLYCLSIVCAIAAEWLALRFGVGELSHSMFLELAILSLFMFPMLDGGGLYPLNPPAWSLFFELFSNLIYGYAAKSLDRKRIVSIMLISAVGLFCCAFATHTHRHPITLNTGFSLSTSPYGVCRVMYSFMAGLLIYRTLEERGDRQFLIPPKYTGFTMASVMVAIVLILTAAPGPALQFPFDLISMLFLFPILTVVAIASDHAVQNNRLFAFLGTTSYGVYVLHRPLSRLIEVALRTWAGIDVASYAPWSGLVFLAGLLTVCWYLEKLVDLPIRRHFGRLLRG
jgi:peptidoglycan/LPS O-acetylase OafA/YrhL